MIKFFRQTRQQLMEKKKTVQYFKYAIGEIILVVIGILIALSLNTWNQNRVNKIVEQELLNNLLSDVEIDIQNLQYQDSLISLAFSSKMNLLRFINGVALPSDSVFYYLSNTGPANSFTPNTITYDEMRNSNGFQVISSKEIRREIAILYKQYEIVKAREAS